MKLIPFTRHFNEWKYATSVVGLRGMLEKVPETWEMKDSQDSKGGTLDEMPDSREKELIEPTSTRKTGRTSNEGG
jgi:hypothetical protein